MGVFMDLSWGNNTESGAAGFVQKVFSFSESIEYRRVISVEDFEEVGRLRSRSFNHYGIYTEKCPDVMIDDSDFVESCYCYGIYVDGSLKATIRLEHVKQEHPESLVTEFFPDLVNPLVEQGMSFIVPGRFAMDLDYEGKGLALQLMVMRLSGMALIHFNGTALLSLIRKRHAGYQRRFFSATQISPLRDIEGVTEKMMVYQFPLTRTEKVAERFPFSRSLPVERKLLFDRPALHVPRPLIVVPTCYEANSMSNPRYLRSIAS